MRSQSASKVFVIAASSAVIAALLYAFLVEPFWIEISIHQIAKVHQRNTVRIAQVSDLHLQEFGKREIAVTEHLHELKPDLIVLSGDVIDRPDVLPALEQFLASLPEAKVVAVLGNWEYWSEVDFNALKDVYETRSGVRLLINQIETIKVRDRDLRIVGLDDFTAGMPDSGLVDSQGPVTGLTILVEHSPGFFSSPTVKPSSQKVDLCLSGHTHAGQITILGFPVWKPPGSGEFTSGWYDVGLCRLYVSRGIGTSILPARLGSRPEIAVFDL
jgi:predicted MPP superfamily phosphohydrolase